MPWQSQGGGGPWGGGSGGGGGPWGGRGGTGGGGGGRGSNGSGGGGGGGPFGGGGGGQQPPDIEDLIRQGQERLKRFIPGSGGGGMGRGLALVAAVLVGVWLLTGFYRVQTDQQGVVMRFGEWVNTTQPGLNWHIPYPVETVRTPSVEEINQIDIGFRQIGSNTERDVQEESLMLTGDQNIIDIDMSVQWKIADAGRYLFNIRDPRGTVKIAAESAMREIIGRTDIQPALTEARAAVEDRTRTLLQNILEGYDAGILITGLKLQNVQPPQQVVDAFNDVQRALQDRDRLRNEAQSYRNDILPRARGEAQKMLQNAKAYRERLTNEAEGEAERFTQVLEAYQASPEVTKRRMYLETMQKVYARTEKVLMDGGTSNAVPYLPLNELRRQNGTNTSNAASNR